MSIPKTPTFNDILNILDGAVEESTIKKSLAVAKNETFEKQNIVIFAEAPNFGSVIGENLRPILRAYDEAIEKAGDDVDIMSLKPSERRDIIWAQLKDSQYGIVDRWGTEEKQAVFGFVNNIAHSGMNVEKLRELKRPFIRMEEYSQVIKLSLIHI